MNIPSLRKKRESLGHPPILSLCYDFHVGNHDNGNVYQLANGKDSNRTQNFTYDALNRIATAYTNGTNWGEIFSIDPWGNLTARNGMPGKNMYEPLSVGQATVKNQLPGFSYDSAGNMTQNGGATYVYDAENRLKSAGGVTYTYDGDGNRVMKSSGTIYWGGGEGGALAETGLSGNIVNEYIFFDGERLARVDDPGIHYYFSNQLNSTSVITDDQGNIQAEWDYYPYGKDIPVITGDPNNHYKFTGKERDAESGNDYFDARYYASSMGRFMSPDWSAKEEPVPYAKLDNPQSLNLYAYVLNNPLSNVDTDGHACESLYFNTGSGFCTRATEYGQIDARSGIQSQTRFFAAANAVSQALADVATPISGIFVSGKTANFLEGVGENLQKMNESEAAAIQNGSLSGPNLDQQLVHNEQTSVQDQLNGFQQSDSAGYTKAIGEINGSLNGLATKGLEQLTGTDRAYAGVLAGVRKDLGRNIDFSKQGDREAIGNALIKHVRQTGGCDLNGSKQAGCK